MESSHRCDICIIDVRKASFAKLWRSKKHLEKKSKDDIIIPVWLFEEEQETIKKKQRW